MLSRRIFLVLKKFMAFLRGNSRCLVFPVERSVFPILFPSKNVLVLSSGKVGVAPLFLPSEKVLCPSFFLHKNSETSEKQFLVKNWSCFFCEECESIICKEKVEHQRIMKNEGGILLCTSYLFHPEKLVNAWRFPNSILVRGGFFECAMGKYMGVSNVFLF